MASDALKDFISGYSIEVVPNSAAKVENFAEILPANTRVYIAHLSEKEDIKTMVATAKRISEEGFSVMPHIPARIIKDKATLVNWISMYRNEANVTEALLIGGGASQPLGNFDSSIQLIESGVFDDAGFKRLHIAGHPEGSKDIDPDGSNANVSSALSWKQEFSNRTDAEMAIATQFCFDATAVTKWAERLSSNSREQQKEFLSYCSFLVREAMLVSYKSENLTSFISSSDFKIEKLSPFIHSRNIIEIIDLVEDSHYSISRNVNSKIVFTNFAIHLTKLINLSEN